MKEKTAMMTLFDGFKMMSKQMRDAGDEQSAGLIDFLCERENTAIEKEKEQIIKANRDGVDMAISDKFITGEQYYNETYKHEA